MSASPQLPNPYGPPIRQDAARRVAEAALAFAAARGLFVAVAVADGAGDLVCFLRADEVQRASIEVALAKARCAARYKRPTKAFEDRAAGSPGILGLPGVLAVEGGLPLLSGGAVVGAIGVSGALPAEDGACAEAGRAAL
jgi:glc operon protein GlcG